MNLSVYLFFSLSLLKNLVNSQYFGGPLGYNNWNYPHNHIGHEERFTREDLSNNIHGNSQTDCNDYWSIQREYRNAWGLLSIPPRSRYTINLKVILKVGESLPSSYVGRIELAKATQSVISDIAENRPIQYRITFPIQNPLPLIEKVFYNNEQICDTIVDLRYARSITTITLDYSLYTALDSYGYPEYAPQAPVHQPPPPPPPPPRTSTERQNPFHRYTTVPPIVRTTLPPRTTKPPNRVAATVNLNLECGKQHPSFTENRELSLVLNGQNSKRGQFPWLAAFFYNGGRRNGIICGGSLVSSKVVVTAAHCVQDKGEETAKRASDSFFYLGKFDITNIQESNYKQSATREFIIHPHWRPTLKSYDADIAIAILADTIPFTNFIKPICLWTETESYNDMVDKKGMVAGWGVTKSIDEPNKIPLFTTLKVVDEKTCTESQSDFKQLISYRTFCAGSNGSSGPCLGDSGGGFIMKHNNQWFLRGVISASLLDPELNTCDVNNYAVFTDVAPFNDWIQKEITKNG